MKARARVYAWAICLGSKRFADAPEKMKKLINEIFLEEFNITAEEFEEQNNE